jgi:hypothetical protein
MLAQLLDADWLQGLTNPFLRSPLSTQLSINIIPKLLLLSVPLDPALPAR